MSIGFKQNEDGSWTSYKIKDKVKNKKQDTARADNPPPAMDEVKRGRPKKQAEDEESE